MAKVLGIGGVFFKARDRQALIAWYRDHLGLPLGGDGAIFPHAPLPAKSYSVFSIFKSDTKYFDPSPQAFMINLIVDDAEAVLNRAVGGGAHKAGEIDRGEYGTFAWFIDPEGNKVELWQQPS